MTSVAQTYEVDECIGRLLSNGLQVVYERLDAGAEAAGQVRATDGDEQVLSSFEMQHQDVFDALLARRQQVRRLRVDVNLDLNTAFLT